MGYKITAAATAVLTTAQLREQLRLTATGSPTPSHPHDSLIDGLLLAAQEKAQAWTGRAIGAQTVELALDAFPVCGDLSIALPLGAATITHVKYTPAAGGDVVTVSSAAYSLDNYSFVHRLCPVSEWPSASLVATVPNAVIVTYVTPAEVPDATKAALKLMVQHLYDNPMAEGEFPPAIYALLGPQKVWAL